MEGFRYDNKKEMLMLENEQLATTDEVVIAENSNVEPTEVDNSGSNEPVTNESAANGNEAETKAVEPDEIIKKSFGDVEADSVKKFIQKLHGDVDIKDLTERELKTLKSAYHSEKLALEKSQKLSESERKQKESELKHQESSIKEEDTKLKNWYDSQLKTEIEQKSQARQIERERLKNQGYSSEQIDAHLDNFDKQLDQLFLGRKGNLDKFYENKKTENEKSRQEFISKQFTDIEEDLKDDLSDPAFKHVFNEYKAKYPNAKDFKEVVAPWIKEAFRIRDEEKAKTSQTNQGKDTVKAAQKGAGGASKDVPASSGDPVKTLMGDKSAMAAWLRSK